MVVDQCLTRLAVPAVIVLWQVIDREPLKSFAKPEYFNDLGNLLLTLVILWAYMNFAVQYLSHLDPATSRKTSATISAATIARIFLPSPEFLIS